MHYENVSFEATPALLGDLVEFVDRQSPEELLSDAVAIKLGGYVDDKLKAGHYEGAYAATDLIRSRLWSAMDGQPTREPTHLAAALFFESMRANLSDGLSGPPVSLGMQVREHIMGLSAQITADSPTLLSLHEDLALCTVFNAGTPLASGLNLALVEYRAEGGVKRRGFAVGVEDSFPILLKEATNTWLERDGSLDPASVPIRLTQGDEAIKRCLRNDFKRFVSQIDYLARLRKREEVLTAGQLLSLAHTVQDVALRLAPRLSATQALGFSFEEVGVTAAWQQRFSRIMEKHQGYILANSALSQDMVVL